MPEVDEDGMDIHCSTSYKIDEFFLVKLTLLKATDVFIIEPVAMPSCKVVAIADFCNTLYAGF
jgi:hypothetical protein